MYVFFGHHKAASTWIFRICRSICDQLGLSFETNPDLDGGKEPRADFIAFGNAEIHHAKHLSEFRGFHVIRDPRDIIVSAYFSHKLSHPIEGEDWLVGPREILNTVDQEQGLRLSIEWRAEQFKRMGDWMYDHGNIYESRFEILTTWPEVEFKNIFKFLGLLPDPLTPELLTEILEANAFARLTGGRKKGIEDVESHYRKGIPGDWRNHLHGSNKEVVKERYGQLLIDLGYEQNMDW